MLSRTMIAPLRAFRPQSEAMRTMSTSVRVCTTRVTRDSVVPVRSRGSAVRPDLSPANSAVSQGPPVAQRQLPPTVAEYGVEQAPNRFDTWSFSQRPKSEAMVGPRFEQMDPRFQPQGLSAMELIHEHPIQMIPARRVACDGGDGPLGHPRVYINLDQEGPHPCPYCGIRFQQDHADHH